MKLKDKVAIITASGAGIAKSIAFAYLEEGAKVVFVDINQEALKGLEKELKIEKDRYLTVPTDLNNKTSIDKMVDAVLKKFGTIDILVNHAGDAFLQPFSEVKDADFDFAVNITLRSTFWCTKAVIPIMQKNGCGTIINTSSIAGKIGMPNSTMICMVKAGILGLTRALAVEYGRHGINVNAVCPALLETETTKQRMIPNFDFVKEIVENNSALGRLTTPEEIARIYVFLASDDARFMTGQAINFTGGFVMH
ncbi:MAG: SDR family oxidoreductase [Candidatus Aminicenantes bacterium]|nr:SDR family oxidoreductase [Candidatus Aminicenantes bacterium]